MSNPGNYFIGTATVASGATTSTEVDIGQSYDHVYLHIPAGNVGDTQIWAAAEKGGTAYPIANSSGTKYTFGSAVCGVLALLNQHGRYCTIVASTAPANGADYTFVCFS